MQEAIDFVEMLMDRGGELTGVPTGFKDFDEKTGGLQPGELIIIAGRPSMGKTALALNIARNAAIDHRKKVGDLLARDDEARADAAAALVRGARWTSRASTAASARQSTTRSWCRRAGDLADAEIWIDDSGMITILEIKAKCRRLASERGLDLVIVDYLQLAHGDRPAQRKDLEIAEISHGLKALAKELDIPVIALSQLNRGPEQRDPDKRRPNMGDLRESGAIEQDADLIAFIYRDEVYNPNEENRGLAELIIAKQRNGPTGYGPAQLRGALCAVSGISPMRPATGSSCRCAAPGASSETAWIPTTTRTPLLVSELRKPRALRPGGTLGIAAPGGPVDPERVAAGEALLRKAGFRTWRRDDLTAQRGYLAGDDERRADELMQLVERSTDRRDRLRPGRLRLRPDPRNDSTRRRCEPPRSPSSATATSRRCCSGSGAARGSRASTARCSSTAASWTRRRSRPCWPSSRARWRCRWC